MTRCLSIFLLLACWIVTPVCALESFDPAAFGAFPDDELDDREAIQAALDAAGLAGGGTVELDAGTYQVSMIYKLGAAGKTQGCHGLVVPQGCHLKGAGREDTLVRLTTSFPASSALVGNGIVVRGYDTTSTDFGADGNITLSDFTIGTAVPDSWTTGNLIGIGHGHDILLERLTIGASRFHAVEINRSRDITIRDCKFHGEHYGGATLQYDIAAMGAVSALPANTTVQDILVERCSFTGRENETLGGMVIELSHNGLLHLRRASFIDCYIDGLNHSTGVSVAFSNPQPASVEGLLFERCVFNGRHQGIAYHAMLNLNYVEPGWMKHVIVRGCTFQGLFWHGVLIGYVDFNYSVNHERRDDILLEDNVFRPSLTRETPAMNSSLRMLGASACNRITIRRNVVEYPAEAANSAMGVSIGIQCSHSLNAEVSDNTIVWNHSAESSGFPQPVTWMGICTYSWKLEQAGIPASLKLTGNHFGFAPGSIRCAVAMTTSIPSTSWAPGAPWVRGRIAGNYAAGLAQNPANTWQIDHDLSDASNLGEERIAGPDTSTAQGWYPCNGAPLTSLDRGYNQIARLNGMRMGMTGQLPLHPGRAVRLHGPQDGQALLAPQLERFRSPVWRGSVDSPAALTALPTPSLTEREVRFVRSSAELYQWQGALPPSEAGAEDLEPSDKYPPPPPPPPPPEDGNGKGNPQEGDGGGDEQSVKLPPAKTPGFWVRIRCSSAPLDDMADPDQDGQDNLLESALLGDPFDSAVLPSPQLSSADGQTTLRFSCAARRDLRLVLQKSDDLVVWTNVAVSEGGAAFICPAEGASVQETGNAIRRDIAFTIVESETGRSFWRMLPERLP